MQVFPFPGRDASYQLPFTRVVYIEQDDFREQDQKKYFGLAPGKSVLLRCVLLPTSVTCSAVGLPHTAVNPGCEWPLLFLQHCS